MNTETVENVPSLRDLAAELIDLAAQATPPRWTSEGDSGIRSTAKGRYCVIVARKGRVYSEYSSDGASVEITDADAAFICFARNHAADIAVAFLAADPARNIEGAPV